MHDQADQLRQLVRDTVNEQPALQPGVPLVVVSGGARCVGVSTVVIHLANELAALGCRTVIVDAHPQQRELASLLGLSVRGGLADVLDGGRSAVEILEPVDEGVALLPGGWEGDVPPPLDRKAVNRCFAELRGLHSRADFVLVDCGSGMSPWVQRFWQAARQVLMVTTGQPSAIKESYAAIKLAPWGDVDGKVRLLINSATDLQSAEQVATRFSATCRQFLGIKMGEPAAVVSRAASKLAETRRLEPSGDDLAFRQSLRLLAADVVAGSLATSRRVKPAATQPSDGSNRGVRKIVGHVN